MRLIDADTLKEQIPETSVDIFENCRNCSLLDKDQVLEIIDAAPTIDAEPIRHGRWIYRVYREYNSLTSRELTSIAFYKCSVCGHSSGVDIDNYCPHCGAKMDQKEEQT